MKITYLCHSGVSVETEKSVLIFDYYKGAIPKFHPEKSFYVFVSHRHPDHFTRKIFELSDQYPNVQYILSSDIKLNIFKTKEIESIRTKESQIIKIGPQQEKMLGEIRIKTLKSTDTGVAFLVEVEDEIIYHAGDLNWWHWNGESKAYNRNMEVNYKREVDRIKEEHVRAAFLPLDPRLEDAYDKGARYFLETVDCDYIFPIHMWDEYEIIGKFKESLPDNLQEKIMEIFHANQQFVI